MAWLISFEGMFFQNLDGGEHWGNVLSKTTVKSLTCKLAMLQASVWLTIQRLPRTKMRWVLRLHYRMQDMFSSFVIPAKHDVSLTWWGRISSAKITSAIGKPYLVQTSTCCDLADGFSRDGLGLWFDKGHPFASKLIGFDLKVFVWHPRCWAFKLVPVVLPYDEPIIA